MTNIVKADQQQISTVHSVEDVWRMANAMAKSKLFGMQTPEQALALMLIAQAEGLHPATAARDYHIIQGRPALKSDAILARFQAAGGSVEWPELNDSKVVGKFSHPQGGTVVIDWDMKRAAAAGLGIKDNWKKYPRQMLRARVISEGVRTVYPAVLSGMYTPEEVSDFQPQRKSEPPHEDYQEIAEAEIVKQPEIAPERTETPVASKKLAASAIPLNELVRVNLANGQRSDLSDNRVKLSWDVTYGNATVRAYCWHKNKPREATGMDAPEDFTGQVELILSLQGRGQDRFYQIDDMFPVLDLEAGDETA